MAIDLTPIGVPGSSYDDFGLKSSSGGATLVGVSANGNRGDLHVKRVISAYSDLGPSGRPTGLYSFTNQITTELVGTQGSASNGSLTVTGDATEVLTTQLATSALGSITASIPKTLALTGLAGTTSLGSITPNYAWTQSLTAVEGTGTLGAIVLGVNLTTLLGTTALGTLSLTTASTITLDSAVGTGTLGSVAPLTDQFLTLTGQAGTTTLGGLAVSVPDVGRAVYSDLSPMGTPGVVYTFVAATPVTVSIDGVEATGAVAVFDGTTLQQTPDAISATGSTNAVTTDQGNTTDLTTLVGTTALGTLDLPETISLTGVVANALLGGISAQGDDVSFELGGFQANTGLGSLSLSVDSVVPLGGVSGTGVVANVVFDEMIGVEGVTSLGTLTDTQGSTVVLQGVNAQVKTGHLVGSRTDNVFPLYYRVTIENAPSWNSATLSREVSGMVRFVDDFLVSEEIRKNAYDGVLITGVLFERVVINDDDFGSVMTTVDKLARVA